MAVQHFPKISQPRKKYWWPYRPQLRVVARVVGILMLAAGIWQGFTTGHWKIGSFALPLAFLFGSLIPPERRS